MEQAIVAVDLLDLAQTLNHTADQLSENMLTFNYKNVSIIFVCVSNIDSTATMFGINLVKGRDLLPPSPHTYPLILCCVFCSENMSVSII